MDDFNKVDIHFYGPERDHNVPLTMLIQTLDSLQKIVYGIAMEKSGVLFRVRDRVPADLEREYTVFCLPPRKGSFAMSAIIGDPDFKLTSRPDIEDIIKIFDEIVDSVFKNVPDVFLKHIRSKRRQIKIIDSIEKMFPKTGSGWRTDVISKSKKFDFSESNFQKIKSFREVALKTIKENIPVIGKLMKIDFGERKMTVLYPETGKELNCFYAEDIEDLLLENRRDWIQVEGNVILDDLDKPSKIVEVENIRDVDLSQIVIKEVNWASKRLIFFSPLKLIPELDEDSHQLFCVEDEKLNIDAFAATREELLNELNEQIFMLWEDYAQAPDDKLTTDALVLKKRLLSSIEEVK